MFVRSVGVLTIPRFWNKFLINDLKFWTREGDLRVLKNSVAKNCFNHAFYYSDI
ncbi:hypothetical protein LEP1GSC055_2995 [Leptospira borgpetersenii str. Brem 307]|uniref:Uncharacterized protein n=1 Tax=Leptospira borgpetersenii str. Brem 328 TaxID=1049780 RepID=A0ABC9SFA7_LEPBO|nr:hypothetical protein LEP1GSC055_2995 [Leptospira borgpetersenii str. Brem 307]EMN16401.1 hypothetical protein LEP1GSC056_3235 [Leptospira borgpetersenii str. Brem 328]